jgi:hypothetical protein
MLRSTQRELKIGMQQLQQEIRAMQLQITEAARAHDLAEEAGKEAIASVAAVGETARVNADIQRKVEEKMQRLQQMESELSFITAQPEVGFSALLTLQAMRASGYRLRETLSKDGLIAYFESEDAAHQIAVRCRSPQSLGPQSERWEMEAETFEIKDESCCGVMNDFFEGLEETDLCTITVKERKYPKRDGETGIPVPRQRLRERHGESSTRRTIHA